MNKHDLQRVVSFLLALGLAGCGGGSGSGTVPSLNTNSGLPLQTTNAVPQSITADAASTQMQARTSATVSSTVSSYTAINAGGAAAAGNWLKDTGHGGYGETVSDAINVSHVTNAAPQSVYQSQRTGNSSYGIASLTPNGTYVARLHFVESWWQS